MTYSIDRIPPKNFHGKLEMACCLLRHKGTLLLLKRAPDKPQNGRWVIPLRKVSENETPKRAAIQEIEQSTSLKIQEEEVKMIDRLFCHSPKADFVLDVFFCEYKENPKGLKLNGDHSEFKWVKQEEALILPLMIGGKEALESYKKTFPTKP